MIQANELLQAYLDGVRSTSGAASASLFVPPSPSGVTPPLLIAAGPGPPVPELATHESATAWSTTRPEDGSECLPSSDDLGCLIRLEGGAAQAAAWLGLLFPADRGRDVEALQAGVPPGRESAAWRWMLELGALLAPHVSRVSALLVDPITGLPTRTGLHALLSDELERSRRDGRPLALLLTNPDDFPAINESFGREAGDRIVEDIAERLRAVVRRPAGCYRYGGVVFAVTLTDTSPTEAKRVAGQLMAELSESAYLDGAVRLGFSIGVAVFDPAEEAPGTALDLIRRSDQALNAAKRLGGGTVVDRAGRAMIEEPGNFDRLNGIFTGNMAKDYRNMVMLWDTIQVVASHSDFDELAENVVDRLYAAFKPDRVGLFATSEGGGLQLVRGLTRKRRRSGAQTRVATIRLREDDTELMRRALKEGAPPAPDSDTDRLPTAYAVPLSTGDERLGCLFLQGRETALELDPSDHVFLQALASQLALALDRARLSELEARRREQERRRMKAELNELRHALGQAKLVYRAPEMAAAVATARRVAPTDATVLITGPSGTGKELLARTIHELSPRRDRALVVVDCSAIPSTLIESELFGHERGAYTGAERRRSGRLAEADAGTLLLDEIAELPLEVQSRLLRFVQEKQFTPVGGRRPRRVDVRILAATNRDLAEEVGAGRFREDLYYRLDVVSLAVPALRDRPEDILFLARHFLESFGLRYQKHVQRLSPEAEYALVAYDWPGNVRELQNRIMQAVILSESEVIEASALGLEGWAGPQRRPRSRERPPHPRRTARSHPVTPLPHAGREPLAALGEALGREIDLSLQTADLPPPPLGRWLRDDLILAADAAAGGVARQGARLLGLPETTYRRRRAQAARRTAEGRTRRSESWPDSARWLSPLLDVPRPGGRDLLDVAETCLIRQILERAAGEVKTGAALLGVSPPTYRRRIATAISRGEHDDPAGSREGQLS